MTIDPDIVPTTAEEAVSILASKVEDSEREFADIPVDLFVLPVTLHPDGSISTDTAEYPNPQDDNQDPT